MARSLRKLILSLSLLASAAFFGCAAADPGTVEMSLRNLQPNDAPQIVTLEAFASPNRWVLECDSPSGCDGLIAFDIHAEDTCALFNDGCTAERQETPIAVLHSARTDTSQIDVSPTESGLAEPSQTDTITLVHEGRLLPIAPLAIRLNAGEQMAVNVESVDCPNVELHVRASWMARPSATVPLVPVQPTAVRIPEEITEYMDGIQGLDYLEVRTSVPGLREFRLFLTQPLDHADPESPTFTQIGRLHHLDREAPMVFYTSGYHMFEAYYSELGMALGANQVEIEHRFFGYSQPEPLLPEHWESVTVEQAAHDMHTLVEALRPYYASRWVGTGHSKGGMTAIYHRYFFPEDVDLTVPYVSPYSHAPADPRYHDFVNNIGPERCRAAIRDIQRALLERLDEAVPYLRERGREYGFRYESDAQVRALTEDTIESFEWGFWQSQGAAYCGGLDRSFVDEVEPENWARFYEENIGFPTPPSFYQPGAYEYQAVTQLGYQGIPVAHLDPLLEDPGTEFRTPVEAPAFDPLPLEEIQEWVLADEVPMLFVYGEFDPWTGGAYAMPEGGERVTRVTVPDANHGAFLAQLPPSVRSEASAIIEDAIGARPNFGFGISHHVARPPHFAHARMGHALP